MFLLRNCYFGSGHSQRTNEGDDEVRYAGTGIVILTPTNPAPRFQPLNWRNGWWARRRNNHAAVTDVLAVKPPPSNLFQRNRPRPHQQNRRSATRCCNCCDDWTAPSTTEIPLQHLFTAPQRSLCCHAWTFPIGWNLIKK